MSTVENHQATNESVVKDIPGSSLLRGQISYMSPVPLEVLNFLLLYHLFFVLPDLYKF